SRKRLEESVARVLDAKIRLGLLRRKTVDLDAIGDTIGDPDTQRVAERVAEEAVTLLKNLNNAVPLATPEKACAAVITGGRYSQYGRVMMHELHERVAGMKIGVYDPSTPADELQVAAKDYSGCSAVVVTAFASVSAYKGSVGLPSDLAGFVNTLTDGSAPVIMIALGNPYLIRSFPKVASYMATYSTASTSEVAAVRALLGQAPITGHTPVSIPGFAAIGDGIQLTPAAPTAAPRTSGR